MFAKASNFIYKVTKHELLNNEETKGILYKQGEDTDAQIGTSEWHRQLENKYYDFCISKSLQSRTDFKHINSPEGIRNINHPYRVIYYLRMQESDFVDVSQYRDLVLLIEGYKGAEIHGHIIGGKKLYFQLSQYLAWIALSFELRNYIYYEDKNDESGKPKRLQSKGILKSTSFLPLLYVNEENVQRMRDNCVHQLGQAVFLKIICEQCEYKNIEADIKWTELGGIVMRFLKCKDIFAQINADDLKHILSQLDVLALALVVYSIKEDNRQWSAGEFNAYVKQQQQYANACHQLMENILFHSVAKWGLFSARVKKENLEIAICDFSADRLNKNMAEEFVDKLDVEWKDSFAGLQPENLFRSALGVGDEYIRVWQEYYSHPECFGKHFGLRIFQGITRSCKGAFWAESHSSHILKSGEQYLYGDGIIKSASNYVMPGTTYTILFPLRQDRDAYGKEATQEYGNEHGNWLCNRPEKLLKLRNREYEIECLNKVATNETEKNNIIRSRAEHIRTFMEMSDKTDIISVCADEFDGKDAELWAKSILIAQCCNEIRPHFVIWNCSEIFATGFCEVIRGLCSGGAENVFCNDRFQIALISLTGIQTIFLPGDMNLSDRLNRFNNRMRGIKSSIRFMDHEDEYDDGEISKNFIPFDVIVRSNGKSLFEEHVRQILEQDIQSEQYGCKINSTHMRLGSTIHINKFYEAEILFGNIYFISRFAFLMLQDIYESLLKSHNKKITLYGYASYSETLLVMFRKAILALGKEHGIEFDVDFIFLEREEERRERGHIDRIRYGRTFGQNGETGDKEYGRESYMEQRQYIVIIPINSTLKTHQRLIGLLKEETPQITDDHILRNYALILIGPDKCKYWEKSDNNVLLCTYHIKPDPRYFIQVNTDYQEPLTCEMCFPKHAIWEKPLIEVNAASTIPDQAFGIVTYRQLQQVKMREITSFIEREEEKLSAVKGCLVYKHLTRNDSHFLFYVKTEELVVLEEKRIIKSLQEWAGNVKIKDTEYHIIVAPMHYSNCQFVEMVNEQIFSGMASVLRIDFNKDFRNNAYAKYSNIRQYLRQLSEMEKEIQVKFHYVDDSIITGRTFFRAKSLVESITNLYREDFPNVQVAIFDCIFTLLDRNSTETRMQYLGSTTKIDDAEKYFYCFLNIKVSCLRNYGDSCTICNLHKEADHLYCNSSTGMMSDYWSAAHKKFRLLTLEDIGMKDDQSISSENEKIKERAYHRLFCTHMIKVVLDEIGFDNRTDCAAKILLALFLQDYKYRKADSNEAFEYFISYLKVCSRPFLVFQKPVKEAIYDILLILMEGIVKREKVQSIIDRGKDEKPYWDDLRSEWTELESEILSNLTLKQQRDLVLMIMKQQAELKSNYIIRLANMNAIFEFMFSLNNGLEMKDWNDEERKAWIDFWQRYAVFIKRLTGSGSDTSKSMWLDYALMHGKEIKKVQVIEEEQVSVRSGKIDPMFEILVRLENTSNFQDGIAKIYKFLQMDAEAWDSIEQYVAVFYGEEYLNYVMNEYLSCCKEQVLGSDSNSNKCREELLRRTSDKCVICPGNIKEAFLAGKDMKETYDFLKNKLDSHAHMPRFKCQEEIGRFYEKSIDSYQFMNFGKLMIEMGWGIGENSDIKPTWKFNADGIRQITCCVAIKKLCENADYTEEALLNRIDKIAKLSGAVLQDVPVQIWAEYQDASEFYKVVIADLVRQKEQELGVAEDEAIHLDIKKHYHTLGDNTGYVVELDENIQNLLNEKEILNQLKTYGFYYKGKDFIWKIGRKSKYPLYLCARNETENKEFLYNVRNLLSLSYDIEQSLFSAGKQNYLHEIDMANSRLSMLDRNKSMIHAKEENRVKAFDRLINTRSKCAIKQDSGTKGTESDDALVLLADLNVSRIYRRSLNKSFYQLESSEEFGDLVIDWNVFGNCEIKEQMHGDEENHVTVKFDVQVSTDKKIFNTEKTIFRDTRKQEILSLLLALILNVKENGRGIDEGETRNKIIFVSKTERGTVRILNKTNLDSIEIDRIKKCLSQEPAGEESGITLWSLNCCIKRAIVGYVRQMLEREDIDGVKHIAQRLTAGDFEIKLEVKPIDDQYYFSYELPILRELYESKEVEAKGDGEK